MSTPGSDDEKKASDEISADELADLFGKENAKTPAEKSAAPEKKEEKMEDFISADELEAIGQLTKSSAQPSAQPQTPTPTQPQAQTPSQDEIDKLLGKTTTSAPTPPPPSVTDIPPQNTPTYLPPNFAGLSPQTQNNAEYDNGIELLMDVPLTVSVELGRITMTLQQILSVGRGTIIELERLAGEPVDILVNDKLIGHGEVVVVDEYFGVKITDLIDSKG